MNASINNLRNRRNLRLPTFLRSTSAILVYLTVIAGLLRFVAIDLPNIWGDEVATYGRISGTYKELLEQLSDRSVFTPLHYELYWWIAQGMPYWGKVVEGNFEPTHRLIASGVEMTPLMLRLIPALAGTLMVPAIYFLSRQLFGSRVSLLAAFFCCFSAFLLVYSRDGKMYMHFWLFCTLNMGCFLWWVQKRTLTSWLCWILTGIIMIGLHALGRAVLGVELFIALTAPGQYYFRGLAVLMSPRGEHPWRRFRFPLMLIFAIGAAAIYLPTQIYYDAFNKHFERVIAEGERLNTGEAGIHWVAVYNQGRSFGDLVLFTSSAYLTGWEWPRKFPDLRIDEQADVNPMTLKLLKGGTVAILLMLAIGLLPWRKWIAPRDALMDELSQDAGVSRVFSRRRVMWLGVWICVIAFAFYVAAARQPAFVLDAISTIALKSPPDITWPRLPLKPAETDPIAFYSSGTTWQPFKSALPIAWGKFVNAFTRENMAVARLTMIGILVLAVTIMTLIRLRWTWRGVARLASASFIVLMICAVLTLLPQFASSSVWMPRYLGVTFPAIAILIGVLIARQPARWMQVLTLALIIIVNMGQFSARVFGHSEPPNDRIARDVVDSQPHSFIPANDASPTFRAYTFLGGVEGPEPGRGSLFSGPGSYYLRMHAGIRPTNPRIVRFGQYHTLLRVWRYDDPGRIVTDLTRSPQIKRFVVWTAIKEDDLRPTDVLAERLKGKFRRTSEEYIPVFDHWTWRKWFTLVRREYVVM